jgi:hypothetical protein
MAGLSRISTHPRKNTFVLQKGHVRTCSNMASTEIGYQSCYRTLNPLRIIGMPLSLEAPGDGGGLETHLKAPEPTVTTSSRSPDKTGTTPPNNCHDNDNNDTSSRYISTNTLMGLRPKSLSEGTNTCVDTGRTYIGLRSLKWITMSHCNG